MIYVDAKRLCRIGEKLAPEAVEQAPFTRGYLWILPGCLVSGRGPVYRSLDAYFTLTAERPTYDQGSMWLRLGDTRTRADDGVLMVYGTENVMRGGGGYEIKEQIWACKPVLDSPQ